MSIEKSLELKLIEEFPDCRFTGLKLQKPNGKFLWFQKWKTIARYHVGYGAAWYTESEEVAKRLEKIIEGRIVLE